MLHTYIPCTFSIQSEAKEVDKEKHELYAHIEKLEEEENVLKKQQIDITNELDKYENVIKENQQRIKHWKKEVISRCIAESCCKFNVCLQHNRTCHLY